MPIKSKLSQNDFVAVQFILLFKRIGLLLILILYPALLIIGAISKSNFQIFDLIPISIFLFVYPLLIFFSARKKYQLNLQLQEEITYDFLDNELQIVGETFNSTLGWQKIFRIRKLKNYLLIYQNKYGFYIIPLVNLKSEDIEKLKSIAKNHSIKNNLGVKSNENNIID